MVCTFFKTLSDNRELKKKLTKISDLEIQIKYPTDIHEPILILENNTLILNSNYVYIQEFKKYYFIKNLKLLNSKLLQVELSIDVLQTYQNQIINLYGVVERNEYIYNSYYIDSKLLPRVERFLQSKVISDDVISPSGLIYSLSVVGGA